MTDSVQKSASGGTVEAWGRRGDGWVAPTQGNVDLGRLERHRRAGRATRSCSDFLPAGTEMTLLYRHAHEAHRVVRHDERGLVTWTPSGSERLVNVPVDGSHLRSRPAHERFTVAMELRPSTWNGPGILRVFPTGSPWSVWFFCHPDGTPHGHYLNLELPAVIAEDNGRVVVNSIDLTLDIWLEGDTIFLKDEDELDAHVNVVHRYTPEEGADIRAIADQARRDLVEPWAWPLTENWHAWRPTPEMDTPCQLG